MMKVQLLFVIICCLLGCSGQVYLVKSDEQINVKEKVSNVIEDVMHVGPYRPDMQAHDTFFVFLSLAKPLSFSDINFLNISGKELFKNIENLDKLYWFAKMTDHIYICDSIVKESSISFSGLVMEDKTIHMIRTPTYNEDFLLTIPIPKVSDSTKMWNSFSVESFQVDSIRTKGKNLYLRIPQSKIEGELLYLSIHRPWLGDSFSLRSIEECGKIAIIDGLILAKEFLTITKGENSVIEVSKSHKRYKIIDNPTIERTKSNNVVLGFICRIL